MSDFPSSTTIDDSHSDIKPTITSVGKRELIEDACDEMPSKRIALERTKENSNPSFLPVQLAKSKSPPTESEMEVSFSKSDTSWDINTSLSDSTTAVEADVKEKNQENSASNSSDIISKQESSPEIKVKPEIILKISADYASDGELEDSPLPDLPPTSPISDKSEMSPTTRELLTNDSPEAGDKNQTDNNSGAKSCDNSDENLYEDPEISEVKLSSDNQFSESGVIGKSLGDSKPKSEGIELMNFSVKPFVLPDTERFGCCRLITEFQKLSIIGEGAYGIVYKVIDKKNNNSLLALKKLKFNISTEDDLPVQVVREINILKTLEHPNIVNSHGVAVGSNFNNTYLILDFCECDLSKIIDDEKSSVMLKDSEIKCVMLQLLEGLKFIHFNYVIHRFPSTQIYREQAFTLEAAFLSDVRLEGFFQLIGKDLSCSNVLLSSRGIVKIGDFGSSRNIMPNTQMTPNVVSRWYRAPELLFGETVYTSAIDIWSSGCILAEALLKRPLWKAKSDMEMIAAIIDLLGTPTDRIWRGVSQLPVLQNYDLIEQPENRLRFLFKGVSTECFSLLEHLLTYDPKKRITALEAGYHPWFLIPPTACSPDGLTPILNVVQEIVRLRGR